MKDFSAGRTNVECLSDDLLRDFSVGKLENSELRQVVILHLQTCLRCGERLSSLSNSPDAASTQDLTRFSSAEQDHDLCSSQSRAATTTRLLDESVTGLNKEAPRFPALHEELPVRIGEYFVVRKLGKGGTAEVFLAKDPKHDRLVAVKVPRRDRFTTAKAREEFLREARIVAELRHRNIVRLYDCCELNDGQCILVMEYIEGKSLDKLIISPGLDQQRAAEIVATVADALEFAHQRGLLHRDIKPANILVDQQGVPYLSDFGLALHRDLQHAHAKELAGTYAYMSPAQIAGNTEHLDERTDIWSLGVVLYELIARKRPFPANSLPELTAEICDRPHESLSGHSAEVHPALAALCDRCLQKNAVDRPATARQLAAELRDVFAPHSHRRGWAVIGGLAAVLVALVVCVVAGGIRPPANEHSEPRRAATVEPIGSPDDGTTSSFVTSATALPSDGPIKLLAVKPREFAWINALDANKRTLNWYSFSEDRERLTMRHRAALGLLAFRELTTADFSVSFLVKVDGEQGSGGCFWAAMEDSEKLPLRRHRCVALLVRRDPRDLRWKVRFQLFQLEPNEFESTRFRVAEREELASAECPRLNGDTCAIDLRVRGGNVADVRVQGEPVKLNPLGDTPPWLAATPASFGFVSLDGPIVFENPTLVERKVDRGQEKVQAAQVRE